MTPAHRSLQRPLSRCPSGAPAADRRPRRTALLCLLAGILLGGAALALGLALAGRL